ITKPFTASGARVSTGSGDPEVPELPSARGVYPGIGANSVFYLWCPLFDHRSCPFSPSMSDSPLTRFLSGHIRSLTFSDNSKCFEMCPKCTAEQATPDHILACLGLSKQYLVSNPLLTLDFFRMHRLMDLI
ncbi:hypothetical protein AVEN_106973-1, partial [Araneus ventricosus]